MYYVVGVLNFFDNELNLHIIHASDAMSAVASLFQGYDFSMCSSLEDMQNELFNCDIVVNAIEIPVISVI